MSESVSHTPSAMSLYLRAGQLSDLGRYKDAVDVLQQALQSEPDHDLCYNLLAICWMHLEEHAKALGAADRAISLDPEFPNHHIVRAIVLVNGARDGQDSKARDALASAQKAIELNPESSSGHGISSRVYLVLDKFKEAEAAARKALALNPDDTNAGQALSIALMRQGKTEDTSSLVEYQLASNPEDDSTHVSAGFLALRKGDHRKANEHFMEALRLDPTNEGARVGLADSYRARSVVYRTFFRFSHFMERFSGRNQFMIWIGAYLVYQMLRSWLRGISPKLGALLGIVWLLFCFWTVLARGFSSFFMVLDRYARLSLKPKEIWEGAVVGGLTMIALIMLGTSYLFGHGGQAVGALACFLAAVPLAVAFTNDHYVGRWISWALGIAGSVCGIYVMISAAFLLKLPYSGKAFDFTWYIMLAAVLMTLSRRVYR